MFEMQSRSTIASQWIEQRDSILCRKGEGIDMSIIYVYIFQSSIFTCQQNSFPFIEI